MAAPTENELGVDELGMSDNMQLLANSPLRGSFAVPLAFGTDMAFEKDRAYVGNYNGFTIYDISKPSRPREIVQVVCPGSQNDISVSGDLLFLGTDSSRSDDSCASGGQTAATKASWEGIKIFDISDEASPEYIKSVETDCGSHTQTLVPASKRKGKGSGDLYLYVSSYGPDKAFPDCRPKHDKISIVKVPAEDPTKASVVAEPVLFPKGGFAGGSGRSDTSGCHGITVFPDLDVAAGACMGDGVLMDIKDRENPKVVETVRDPNFAFWHSATFNEDGTKVVFTDELGGGGAATCNARTGPTHGANAIYDIRGKKSSPDLKFASYYKIPRYQEDTENCVAHNGSVIPVEGKDIMV